jgi:hypothetical protein
MAEKKKSHFGRCSKLDTYKLCSSPQGKRPAFSPQSASFFGPPEEDLWVRDLAPSLSCLRRSHCLQCPHRALDMAFMTVHSLPWPQVHHSCLCFRDDSITLQRKRLKECFSPTGHAPLDSTYVCLPDPPSL